MGVAKPRLAVIGGGFSGAMTFYQLIAQATGPIDIHLIEPGEIADGIAYSTTDPLHLLNVRAEKMGALAGKPGHFLAWAEGGESLAERKTCGIDRLDPQAFTPRRFYAAYLRFLHREALTEAARKGIDVHLYATEASDLTASEPGLTIHLNTGEAIAVDMAILAIGNLQPYGLPASYRGFAPIESFILPNAWDKNAEHAFRTAAEKLNERSTIFLLGAGLTAIDTILTLQRVGYRGQYVVFSRHGQFPLPHGEQANYCWSDPPRRALALLRALRDAARQTGDWRAVIDGLRPHTVALWQGFSEKEKRLVLKHLTLWNIHRHRMAPEIHRTIEALRHSGRLEILEGNFSAAETQGAHAAITVHIAGEERRIACDYAIPCIGPSYDVERNPHPLLKKLLAGKMVLPSPLHAGLRAAGYHLEGKAQDRLLGLGTILLGERLETTAVPELREQAAEVAAEAIRIVSYRP